MKHFRSELWIPGTAWTRQGWNGWKDSGGHAMAWQAASRARELLAKHQVPPLDPALAAEIEQIVACARNEIV